MQIVYRPRKDGPSKMSLSHGLDSTSSLRLDKDPRWAKEVRKVQLYSYWSPVLGADVSAARSAGVSNPGTARLRCSGLLAPRPRKATVACSMPAPVFSRVARERKFSTLSLRSAVESGSFSTAERSERVENFLFCAIRDHAGAMPPRGASRPEPSRYAAPRSDHVSTARSRSASTLPSVPDLLAPSWVLCSQCELSFVLFGLPPPPPTPSPIFGPWFWHCMSHFPAILLSITPLSLASTTCTPKHHIIAPLGGRPRGSTGVCVSSWSLWGA